MWARDLLRPWGLPPSLPHVWPSLLLPPRTAWQGQDSTGSLSSPERVSLLCMRCVPDDFCLSALSLFCPLSRSRISYALPSSGVLLPVLSGPRLIFLSPKPLAGLRLGA